MNFKTTLALFIIMVVGIAAAVILPKHLRPTDEAKLVRDRVFPDFETKNGRRMEITKDDLRVVCEKKDDVWHIIEPLKDRADETKVEGVLSACEFMRFKGPVKPKDGTVNIADYGLDKPQAEVTIADDEQTRTLLIGKTFEAIGENVSSGDKDLYVKIKEKQTIYCVDDDILKDIDHEVADFRYRHPFELLSHRVEKLELTNEAGAVVAAKEEDDWFLKEPVEDKANGSKIGEIISAVSDAEKQDFTADGVKDFAQYGLDKPAVAVKFWCKKEEGAKTLLVGKAVEPDKKEQEPAEDEEKKPEKVYACVEGQSSVFTLKGEILGKLSPGPADLRNRDLLAVKADDVTAVEIASADSTIALEKEGFDWKMTQPKEVDADGTAAKDLAKLLEETEIDDWIDEPGDLAQYGLDQPTTITLKQKKDDDEEEAKEFKLLVGKKDGDACFVKLPDSPYVIKVKGKVADEAGKGYLAFRNKRMLDFSKWKSKKLDVVRSDGTVFAAAKIEEAKWSISKPVAGTAEMSNLNNILWDLSSFDAEEITVEEAADLAPYGLDKPQITATVAVEGDEEDKEETHTVFIGKEADGKYYAKVDGKDMICTVRKSVYDNLMSNLLSLGVVKFEKDDATALTITRGQETFACSRKDKDADWEVTAPEGRTGSKDTIQAVINELHLLRALRYIEYTPEDLAKYGLDKPAAVVTVKVKDDQDKVLQIGKKREEDGGAYARTADASPVFVISKYTLEQIDQPLSDLLTEEAPEPPEEGDQKQEEEQE